MQLRVPQKQLVLLPWAITEVAAASEVPKMDLQGLLLTNILFFLEEKGRDSCAFYFLWHVVRAKAQRSSGLSLQPGPWALFFLTSLLHPEQAGLDLGTERPQSPRDPTKVPSGTHWTTREADFPHAPSSFTVGKAAGRKGCFGTPTYTKSF